MPCFDFPPSALRLLFLGLLLASGASAPGQSSAAIERPLETIALEARERYSEGSYALAAPLFAEWAGRAPAESAEALEARVFALVCERFGRLANRTWEPGEEEWFEDNAEALEEATRALRERGAPAIESWRRAAEAVGVDLRLETERWNPLGRLLADWARSTDLDRARQEYLRLVWAYSGAGDQVGRLMAADRLPWARNAARLAEEPLEAARFNLLYGRALNPRAEAEWQQRAGDAYMRAARAATPAMEGLFEEAWWSLAQWSERFGTVEYDEDGNRLFGPDYAQAKEAYGRIAGQSELEPWRARAREAITRLERPDLQVLVGHAFRPETEVQFAVRWRNLDAPAIEIYRFDPLAGDYLTWRDRATPPPPVADGERVLGRSLERLPPALHYPVLEPVRLERSLAPAAYAVVARSGESVAWAPLYVTNLVVVTHQVEDEVVAFVADATNGKPRGGVALAAHLRVEPRDRREAAFSAQLSGRSDDDGLWRFQWPEHPEGRVSWAITARAEENHGATVTSAHRWHGYREGLQREAYLLSDRSLYRPGDTVRLAGWLRERDTEGWQPPAAADDYRYTVRSWRGEEAASGSLAVSDLGGFVLDVELPAETALGPYHLEIRGGRGETYWNTPRRLFNVEEYRTPEIEASVELSGDAPRLPGDPIEGIVQVDYYAGGAVEDAAVELVVSRTPFHRVFFPSFEEPWLFHHLRPSFAPEQAEEQLRLQLTTDARGEAPFSIPTAREADRDWTYRLEARVRDLSRRETVAEAQVRVTRQAYFAHLDLRHRLVAPGDEAELTVRLEDANGRPVADEGVIRVVQERWREIYVHRRRGTEISGEEYRNLPDRSMLSAAQSDYRLRESGFVTEEIARFELATGAEGVTRFTYEPAEEGYYTFEWISRGNRGKPVTAEAPLWVSDAATTELGYRPGGVQLIADPGPYAVGDPVPVLVTGPVRNRWALLTVSAEGMLEHRLVRLEGTSRLVMLTVSEAMRPNFFVDASIVSDETHFIDTLELVVPPRDQYLEVSLEPDRDGYEPRDEAQVTLRVRDAAGDPVQTRVAFTASDAALYSLLPDPRVPVREAFYGDKLRRRLEVGSSLEGAPFFQPLEIEDPVFAEEAIELQPFAVEQAELGYAGSQTLGGTRMRSALAEASDGFMADLAAAPAEDLLVYTAATEVGGAAEPFRPSLRQDFRSTLLWEPQLETDANGEARLSFTFPDNLTAWRLQAVAIDDRTRVGEARVRTATRLPLIARLQLPRFLTERDIAVVSGVIQNNTNDLLELSPRLVVQGPLESTREPDEAPLRIKPAGTARTDWALTATAPGSAVLTLTAATAETGDAVQRPLEIVPHGMERLVGRLGRSGGGGVALDLPLPPAAEREHTRITVRLSSSLAPQLLGALPFLIDYPYGCTEQTLSRFLPALVVRRTAQQLGMPLAELDAAVYTRLSPEARSGREDLRAVLDAVLADGLERLAEMQKADGSFPWMPGGSSDPSMTAYAVWALTLATDLGIDEADLNLTRARAWLERALVERDILPAERTWILLALASRHRAEVLGRPSRMEARAFLDLMNQRDALPPMSLAMLALTARYYGFEEDTGVLLANLANSVQMGEGIVPGLTDADGAPLSLPVAHWGRSQGYFFWSEGAVESTAWVLQALLAINPDHPWIEPAVNWLSRNRTGQHWDNTRSTALAVLAMTDYLARSAAGTREARFAVGFEGQPVSPPEGGDWVSRNWVPVTLELPASRFAEAAPGILTLERTDAAAPFYFDVQARFHDRSEGILAGSSDLTVQREYWHLRPVPTLLEGVREVMTPLPNGGAITSGDRLEVVLRLEVPRDLRYVLVEDLKPAGLEAVQVLSGPGAVARELADEGAGAEGAPVYGPRRIAGFQELRERQVAFLFDRLPAGTWEIRYRLRAEAPGRFHGLPTIAGPMYLPHVQGNSAEWILEVQDEN